MEVNNDNERNGPADKGTKNDPQVRDQSAIQPGVQTITRGANDDANEQLTKTAADSFETDPDFGKDADPAFDEVNNQQ
ncbi:MAG: hypothetical protein ABR502_06760 [Chitinophagaceae bacterium]